MSNVDDGAPGDAPDTLDDRLADVRRLLDTFGFETNPDRRRLRRLLIIKLLDGVLADVVDVVRAELARVPPS